MIIVLRASCFLLRMVYQITKSFTFCYGHRLLGDSGKCGHLHGHTARVEVTLSGESLNNLGMVENFDAIKDKIGRWIEETLDHKMLLNKDDPLLKLLKEVGEPVYALDANPTAENLARLIFEAAREKGLSVKKVTFWESPTSAATYSTSL